MPAMSKTVVPIEMYEEALRVGNTSASLANNQLRVNAVLVAAVENALHFIKVGRIGDARDCLQQAGRDAERMLR